MKKYIYSGREYETIFELRAAEKRFVMPDDVSDELLGKMGIKVVEYEPEVQKDNLEEGLARGERTQAVREIKVDVDGMVFDGDEESQSRMSRFISGWPADAKTIRWKLADNSVADVTKDQLVHALELCVAEMSKIWLADA